MVGEEGDDDELPISEKKKEKFLSKQNVTTMTLCRGKTWLFDQKMCPNHASFEWVALVDCFKKHVNFIDTYNNIKKVLRLNCKTQLMEQDALNQKHVTHAALCQPLSHLVEFY